MLFVPDMPYPICKYPGIVYLVKSVKQQPATALFSAVPEPIRPSSIEVV